METVPELVTTGDSKPAPAIEATAPEHKMTPKERQKEFQIVSAAVAILETDLSDTRRRIRNLEKVIDNQDFKPEIRAQALIDLDHLQPQQARLENALRRARADLAKMEDEALKEAYVRVIMEHGKRAQIVIQYTLEDGKKVSYTRHVLKDGAHYVGRSILSDKKVIYRLPSDSVSDAIA